MKEKLKKLLDNAYAPDSKFRVSAIITTNDGKEYHGVNVENASFGATICAERNAICNAIANNVSKDNFDKLYIMTDSKKLTSPCMLCRQSFIELLPSDMEIIIYNIKGDQQKYIVKELCPYPFDKENLS